MLKPIPHGKSVLNGISTFDPDNRVFYTLVEKAHPSTAQEGVSGILLVGYWASDGAMTSPDICQDPHVPCEFPFNVDFWSAINATGGREGAEHV